MTSLAQKLSDIVGQAFEGQDLHVELGVVRVSDRPDLCQFQCNGAMAAAKIAKKNPREVAQGIVDALSGQAEFTNIEIAGPGFINLDVSDAFIAEHLAELDVRGGVAKSGAGKTAVLDYGGPNVAKPMHVGHLRSSIIGDALRRMLAFAGYDAIGDVHMGDWGTPMGMILSELEIRGHEGNVTMDELAEIYPKAAADCKADEARMDKARAATKALQDGDEAYTRTWRQFIDVSIDGMKANFDALGVHFDEWKGEADAHPFIAPMVEGFKTKGVAFQDDGALVVDVEIVYVVDQRQSLHFEQVFRAARLGGLVESDKPELTFAGFGTMNGTDGKPFKTRAGGVMRLEDLIAQAVDKAQARLDEANLADDIDDNERADIADKVGLAAIKFADLQNQRQSDYVFDLDRMTSFEGKTGPYLLYQAVRIQSLLKKAGDHDVDAELHIGEADRTLALLLAEFPDHFENALKNYTPHVLCDYAYKLAQAFSSFYGNCHILSEEDKVLRSSRLALCAMTHRQLVLVLDLLGIKIPARM